MNLSPSFSVALLLMLAMLGLSAYSFGLSGARRRFVRKQLDATALVGQGSPGNRKSFLLRWADRYDQSEKAEPIRLQLQQANIRMKPSDYQAARILFTIFIFVFFFAFLRLGWSLALLGALYIPRYLPAYILKQRRGKYIEAFEEQLVPVAITMSNGLRAGQSIRQAIERVAAEIPDPAGAEFARLYRDIRFNKPEQEAMEEMLQRLPSNELKVLFTAIIVQRQVGGNLARALSEMAQTISERRKLAEEIKAMTAEARYSSIILPMLPIGLLLMLRLLMPDFVDPLFTHPLGWLVLIIFFGSQFLGMTIVRRLSNIRV